MSLAFADWTADPAVTPALPPPSRRRQVEAAVVAACGRIAPLWPLRDFVAVNPFLGFAATPFEAACGHFARLTGAGLVMPRSFYREALASGRMSLDDLRDVLTAHGPGAPALSEVLGAVMRTRPDRPASGRVLTVAQVLDRLPGADRQAAHAAFMVEEISRWCAGYFAPGEAAWTPPWRDMPLYQAWRWAMQHDANAAAMGVSGLKEAAADAAADPVLAIEEVLSALGLPPAVWADYLHKALLDVAGWAGVARQKAWRAQLVGDDDDTLVQLLAIRLVWCSALFNAQRDPAFHKAWRAAVRAAQTTTLDGADGVSVDLVLHEAFERGVQRMLLERFRLVAPGDRPAAPEAQAVFCIDVRSEVYRRALEAAWPGAETLGFAGFFGLPMSIEQAGVAHSQAQCPVLIQPTLTVPPSRARQAGGRIAAGAQTAWAEFRRSAISCFGFVEAAGLAYGWKLAAAALGLKRAAGKGTAAPCPDVHVWPLPQRIELAHAILRGMSLSGGFARLVLLVGHGSSTVNNPHAAGLDCGACGGHSGAPNARAAAALLNDRQVRAGLALRGVTVPEHTWFAPALHDTTTDAVTLLDADTAPASHEADLDACRRRLSVATDLARAVRAPRLGADGGEALVRRSRDWSQVRPEWGLAGCAAFVAAPRTMTARVNFEGRAFLHSYDWRSDEDFKVLTLILTAPAIVASWISLQYFGSTVNNAAFGAGDKTLHNVCGGLGVFEGSGGDLRTGLPLQSVHDGARFVHEPVRLSLFVAAPTEAIAAVLSAHPVIGDLVENRWIHLFALSDDGLPSHRYAGARRWEGLE